jgi:uncharacterized spore protein YtfJ
VEEFNQIHEIIGSKIKDLAKTQTIIGDPMQVGETSIIPVVSIMAGWGAGAGSGKAAQEDQAGGSGGGGGGGGGVRITPVAFIVIKGDDVNLLTLKEARLTTMADLIPAVVEGIQAVKRPKAPEAEGEESG